jgi:hypothetical protein
MTVGFATPPQVLQRLLPPGHSCTGFTYRSDVDIDSVRASFIKVFSCTDRYDEQIKGDGMDEDVARME